MYEAGFQLLTLGGGVLFWLVFTVLVAVGAGNRHRFVFGWCAFALICSPILAGFALLLVGENPRKAT